jgi:phospholipid transport system substrate-binding protein
MNVLRRFTSAMLLSLGAVGVLFSAPAQAQDAAAAEALVKKAATEVLERLNKDPSLATGDPKKMSALVDEVIMPTVNFPRMTSLAVGRDWRAATPEQKKAMTEEFRSLLVRTYSGALTAGKDATVRFKPSRSDSADDIIVRSEILPKRGDAINFDYRLEKVDGQWKIYDVSILGSWLVQSYRAQFAPELSSKGLDGLIKSLADKRKSIEGK